MDVENKRVPALAAQVVFRHMKQILSLIESQVSTSIQKVTGFSKLKLTLEGRDLVKSPVNPICGRRTENEKRQARQTGVEQSEYQRFKNLFTFFFFRHIIY